jgi:Ca2+-binding RTX toxin-like protein
MPIRFATAVAAVCLLLVPASAGAARTARVDAGTLTIGGDGESDRYAIDCYGGMVTISAYEPDNGPATCASIAAIAGDIGHGDDTVDMQGVAREFGFTHPSLSHLSTLISLGPGADIAYAGPLGGRFLGQGGNDQLIGSPERDHFKGGDGSDTLRGRGGPDELEAGNNNDRVFGGPGRDALYGDAGADRMLGGPGSDLLLGMNGPDALFGGAGRDSVYGHRGRDRCRAEARHLCER